MYGTCLKKCLKCGSIWLFQTTFSFVSSFWLYKKKKKHAQNDRKKKSNRSYVNLSHMESKISRRQTGHPHEISCSSSSVHVALTAQIPNFASTKAPKADRCNIRRVLPPFRWRLVGCFKSSMCERDWAGRRVKYRTLQIHSSSCSVTCLSFLGCGPSSFCIHSSKKKSLSWILWISLPLWGTVQYFDCVLL